MGTLGHLKSVKNDKKTFKIPTGIRDQKKSEKVWIWDPPEPQKVGFRLRGVQIFTNPPKPLKVTKKAPTELQNEFKMEPKGSKRRSQGSREGTRKQRMKKTPNEA